MRRLVLILALSMWVSVISAQNEMDAKRISSTGLSGTARVQAMGGAFSAAGGDISSAGLNPAGLALYKRSDVMFTTGLRFVNTRSSFLGEQEDAVRTRAGLTNLGLVLHGQYRPYSDYGRNLEKGPKLKSYAFSAGFNQLENYYRQTQGFGFNNQNSFSSYLASRAQGLSPNQFNSGSLADMGYYVWLIDPKPGDSTSYNAAAPDNVNQSVRRTETGRLNEWNFGLSGNFDDFLYMGVTLGLRNMDYSSAFSFDEDDARKLHGSWGAYNSQTNDSVGFNNLTYTEEFTTTGSGVNFGFGLIVRPSDFARMGLSLQSPTFYSLSDAYSSSLSNRSDQAQSYTYQSDKSYFNYSLTTPFKITGGVSFIVAKSLLLNADVDVMDYRTARFSSSTYNFRTENQAIRNSFDQAYNYRAGAEYKYGPLYFRGGFAWFDPVMNDLGNSYSDINSNGTIKIKAGRQNITGGFGYREETFYIDFAVVRQQFEDKFSAYSGASLPGYSPVLVSKMVSMNYLLTMGLRF